jgi:hypothetical protein
MTHFAQVQATLDPKIFEVVQVIVAEQEFIDSGAVGNHNFWIQTSYNTYGGVHYGSDSKPDSGTPIRANYASIGGTYDLNYTIGSYPGVFYNKKPYSDWVLNTSTFLWEAPIPMPTTVGPYYWNEITHNWIEG